MKVEGWRFLVEVAGRGVAYVFALACADLEGWVRPIRPTWENDTEIATVPFPLSHDQLITRLRPEEGVSSKNMWYCSNRW